MSRKSGFSKGFPFKGPCIKGELPHHAKTLSRCGVPQVGLMLLVGEFADTDCAVLLRHIVNLPYAAHSAKSEKAKCLKAKNLTIGLSGYL
ncbi:MAG: hypothetical protein ETSY2_44085 [Candidatus Entotheonella gemina]|uniref:Uncharacterized protein n=1 Tax=Candidatus Entotheonella gemina TaxID=1429439 RepID=W4LIH3_9BACT|nr:MAG: hypothetical protein ETSY2_44085 [Candidatus Entotheonella gemina]